MQDPTALPISSSHQGAQPFTVVFSKAERLHLPPPLISVGCVWCSATLEKIRLFPQKLSHLLAKSYHVLFSRCRGPLFPARVADQVLRAQESTSTEDQLTMWASSRKSLQRRVVLGGVASLLGLLARQLPLEEGPGVFSFLERTASTILRNLGLARRSPATQGLSAAFPLP